MDNVKINCTSYTQQQTKQNFKKDIYKSIEKVSDTQE